MQAPLPQYPKLNPYPRPPLHSPRNNSPIPYCIPPIPSSNSLLALAIATTYPAPITYWHIYYMLPPLLTYSLHASIYLLIAYYIATHPKQI